MVPFVAFPPATPFTVQVTAVLVLPVTVATYCDAVPQVTVVAPARVSFTLGGGGASRVTTRLCETAGFATLVAVIVTFGDCGAVAGAAKRPFAEIEPHAGSPPTTPFTLHVTAVFVLPFTVATYCEDAPSVTVVIPLRVSVTLGTFGGSRATRTLCATEASAALVAAMVTFEEIGAFIGAL
jgi:hypothetical protein